MNKAKIIELLQNGAYLDVTTAQFFHASFRKGFRKIRVSNISFEAALRELGNKVSYVNGIYSFKAE